ncbi:hypothetical protein ACKWTF_014276 [Chironomus riparius]
MQLATVFLMFLFANSAIGYTRTTATTRSTRGSSKRLTPWIEGCGKAQVGIPTIVGGTQVDKGSHPWIAALIDNTKGYFCGGTLITKRLVLTAAHCILDINFEMQPEDLTVLLGAHQLNSPNDIGKRSYGVESINPHNNWNPHTVKYDADIAVLRLNEDVSFSTYIQPVCLASLSMSLSPFKNGIVVGFGKSETSYSHENVPIKANTPIRSAQDCYNEFPSILNIASRRTFCGGYANGTGACTGDSGSGLTVVQDEVHYLRGIVSASLKDETYGCDLNSYSIFTDLKFYLNFIKKFNY